MEYQEIRNGRLHASCQVYVNQIFQLFDITRTVKWLSQAVNNEAVN